MMHKNWKAVIGSSVLLVSTALAANAYAQQRNFDLPEQEATKSLPEFARQAGIRIAAPAEELKGVRTPKIHGEYDIREALKQLLQGTDLTIASDENQTIVLRKEGLGGLRAALSLLSAHDGKEMRLARAADEDAPVGGAPTGSSPSFTLEEIVVEGKRYGVEQTTVGKLAVPYIDIPQAASIVTSDFLNDAKLFNINDALLFVPGVEPASSFVGTYTIRGVGGLTSHDGIPVTSFPQPIIDAFFYDRIEVVKGPASVAVGRGNPGGYVDFVTKRARFKEGTETMFLVGTGNDQKNTYRATLEQEGFLPGDGSTSYRFLALYDDGAQSMNQNGNYRRSGAQLSIAHRFSENRGRLDVVGSYQRASYSGMIGQGEYSDPYRFRYMQYMAKKTLNVTIPDIELFDGNNLPGLDAAVQNTDSFRLTAILDYKLTDRWSTRVMGGYLDDVHGGDGSILPTLSTGISAANITPDGHGIQGSPFLVPMDQQQITYAAQADLLGSYDFERIGAKLQVLTGADFTDGTYVNGFGRGFAFGPQMPLRAWNASVKLPPYSAVPLDVADVTTGPTTSLYAQIQLNLLQDRLQVSAAGRRIWQDTETFSRANGEVISTKNHSPLLPTYSVLIKPQKWLSIFYARSEHIQPKAVSDVYGYLSSVPPTDVPANDPKRSMRFTLQPGNTQDEVGAKASLFDGNLTVSIAHYKTKIRGGGLYYLEPYVTPDGRTISLFHNFQTGSDISGWEIEAFGQIGQRFTYTFGAALGSGGEQDGVFLGERVRGKVPFTTDSVYGYATYSFGRDRYHGLSITAGGKMIPSGWLMDLAIVPEVPEVLYPKDGYIADLGASYGFGEKYEVFLKGNNIFHEEPVQYSYQYNVPGRQIFAGITARF